jgi:hypothetical protein
MTFIYNLGEMKILKTLFAKFAAALKRIISEEAESMDRFYCNGI